LRRKATEGKGLGSSQLKLAHKFFESIALERNLAEAERTLQTLEKSLGDGEWFRGYLRALEGMLISVRQSSERLSLIHAVPELSRDKLKRLAQEFNTGFKPPVGDEFDRGFFSAWADFLKFLQEAKKR